MTTWFERLMGFREESPEQVRSQIDVDGQYMTSRVNGKRYRYGTLEVVSLNELARRGRIISKSDERSTIRELVADVSTLHADSKNSGTLFQVASQFNLLEMVHPNATPEQGVGIYEFDRTQGPACAIACGSGTIYRNYLVPIGDQTGQTSGVQINCLDEFESAISTACPHPWTYRNGYVMPDSRCLKQVCNHLKSCSDSEIEHLRGLIRIGIQWDTQVTAGEAQHCVTQAYCSALPVTYCSHPRADWEPFAQIVLEAAYEATFWAAALNRERTGNSTLFLTLLGGGAFGNDRRWIMDSLQRAYGQFRDAGLDVRIVSYGRSDAEVVAFANNIQ